MTTGEIPNEFQGYGVLKNGDWFKTQLISYPRKNINPKDVVIKNICCGICGSDLLTLKQQWGPMLREDGCVVGHEIIGHVIATGTEVTEFKVGDRVGVGAHCTSCGGCARCKSDNEQYCLQGVDTYNDVDGLHDDYITQGGYSSHFIANEKEVFAIPAELSSEEAAPLMCAGLTVFSPLVREVGYNATGKTVGIIGIGGLGHLAVQFGKAIGANVVAFSRSSSKKKQALEMGASTFVATGEEKDWTTNFKDGFDLILNCAIGIDGLNLDDYISVLKVGAKFVSVGLPDVKEKYSVSPFTFLQHGAAFGSSLLGSKKEANYMLKLAAEKGVRPWIEKVPVNAKSCSEALQRCDAGDVRYRFVLTDFDKAFSQ